MNKISYSSAIAVFAFLCVPSHLHAQEIGQPPAPFTVTGFVGEGSGDEKRLLETEKFAEPGALMFITEVDSSVMELMRNLNILVKSVNEEKSAYVVYLSKGDERDAEAHDILDEVQSTIGIQSIYIYEAKEGPKGYKGLRDNAVTVIMAAKSKIAVVDRLSLTDIDSQDKQTQVLLKFIRLKNEQ